ncbi:MAG: tRNA (cytidine(34)-2'-O)-methyltransferase [Stomatobaculum sp.]|nr:tRNA (cytidine(34)-2'-O)-methyltransferase [Stomatobaculum sp.]
MLNIVLLEPELPLNTGNIGRTCAATGTRLHLIEPLGFHLSDKWVKRAGLDYWDKVDLEVYVDLEDFFARNPQLSGDPENDAGIPGPRLWLATTKALRSYTDVAYGPDDYLMFGKESAGIPEEILVQHEKQCVRIPMWGEIRSLNLANSAAIVLYEALRQNEFFGLARTGELHRLKWQ